MRTAFLLLLAGCSGGPPPLEARSLPPAVRPGTPAAAAVELQSALEAAGWIVERAGEHGLATRRREEPEDFAWRLELVLSPRAASTIVDATLSLERSDSFRPVEALFRNNARMQADDEFLATKNRPAVARDVVEIESNTPEGRREAAIKRLDARIRSLLAPPPPVK